MTYHQSKRLYPSVSPSAYDRLEASAEEHNVLKEDDTPNVSRFAYDILRFFLNLERMEGMDNFKGKDGSTTMDVIRRATHQFLNNTEDDDDAASHEKRHLN